MTDTEIKSDSVAESAAESAPIPAPAPAPAPVQPRVEVPPSEAETLRKAAENEGHHTLKLLLDKFEGEADNALEWLKETLEEL